jgi:hypothetical protein
MDEKTRVSIAKAAYGEPLAKRKVSESVGAALFIHNKEVDLGAVPQGKGVDMV